MISNYRLSKPCKVCGCEYQYQSKPICVDCQKEKTKAYYQANKEACKKKQREWCVSNQEYVQQRRRAYYEVNGA